MKVHPQSQTYWAYILSKKGDSGEGMWKYGGKINPKIKKIWGKNVYKLVTGETDALEQVWKAIPSAVTKIMSNKFSLSINEQKKLKEFFVAAFH